MTNRRFILVFLVAGVGLTFLAVAGNLEPPGPPAPTMKDLDDVEPRIALRNLFNTLTPIVIDQPGSYYLAENIFAFPGANGITIASDDVTLDLNGFTIYGNTEVGSQDGIGIQNIPTNNVVVKNGIVRDFFDDGIGFDECDNCRIENIIATNNFGEGFEAGNNSLVINCQSDQNQGHGFQLFLGAAAKNCMARSNQQDGFTCSGCMIADCSALNNGGIGIDVSDALVRGSNSVFHGTNLQALGTSVVADTHAP